MVKHSKLGNNGVYTQVVAKDHKNEHTVAVIYLVIAKKLKVKEAGM